MFQAEWTNGQTAGLAALCLASILAILGDTYTTGSGLAHGDVEKNRLARWLFSKIGQAGTAFLGGAFVLFAGGLFAGYGSLQAGYAFFGTVAGLETIRTILNYRLLRKQKISLK